MRVANPKISSRIAMRNAYILVFVTCLFSSGLGQPLEPILAYQDSLGQYSFGYSAPGSARSEIRTKNGETRGAYSYIDDAGIIHSAEYTADEKNGFRVAATNLPQAPLLVQNSEGLFVARTTDAQAGELSEEGQQIGEKNVFLQDLKPLERNIMIQDEGMQLQTRGEQNVTMEVGGNKTSEEIMKNATETKPEARLSQSENAEISKSPNSEKIFQTLEKSNIPVFRIVQENLPVDSSSLHRQIIIQGSPVTPASTISKSSQEAVNKIGKANLKESSATVGDEAKSEDREDVTIDAAKEIITPIRILPVNSAYSSFLKFSPLSTIYYII